MSKLSTSSRLWGCALVLALGGLAIAGCSPQSQPADASNDNAAPAQETTGAMADTGLDPLADWQLSQSTDPTEIYQGIYEGLADRAENHQPEITTYEDGTRVQRTPNAALDSTLQVHDNISFNMYRLAADDRGCNACHEDLAKTAADIAGYPHLDFTNNALGIQWTEAACRGCHVGHFATKYDEWSGVIHNIHNDATNKKFVAEGGNCWSCHYGMTTGENPGMNLWDEVKHEILHGITAISSDKMTGSFEYTQDKTLAADEIFSYSYIRNHDNEAAGVRWAQEYLGLEPENVQQTYDEWTITIGGECDRPATMTLSELMEAIPAKNQILQGQCVDNGPGGSLVMNADVHGILLSDLIEYFGAKDGVQSLLVTAADGSTMAYGVDRITNDNVILGWEIGGEPIAYSTGFPVTVFTPGAALDFEKQVVDIEFSTEPGEVDEAHPHGAHDLDGNNYIYPNVGICFFREGQIIPAGQPYTFQGYAAAINSGVTDIQISMDQGKTWQTFETPNNDFKKWTWWEYTWTPEKPGWYTITVRATADDGTVSYYPAEMMVTVEGEAN